MSTSSARTPLYRIYRLGADGRIRGAEIIEAASDEAALAYAQALHAKLGGPDFELWDRARPVRRSAAALAEA